MGRMVYAGCVQFRMRSTQLSESLNSDLKGISNVILISLGIFKHFEKLVQDKRNNELNVEFE